MRGSAWFPTLGLLAWLCCSGPQPAGAGKVLVMPVDGSHWLSMKILVKELIQKGHEVLVLVPETSLLIKNSETYKTEIYQVPYSKENLEDNFKQMKEGVFKNPTSMDLFVNLELLINFTSMQVTGCESLLKNKTLMTRLRDQGFDAVLTDPFLPCGSILSHLFKIPAVYFLRGLPCGLDLKANQCPSPISYVPVTFSDNTDVMTFPQRVNNMLMYFVEAYLCKVMYREFDTLTSRYLSDVGSYKELISRGAFWLLRYNFIFEYPQPTMPNTVFIGGINCAKKAPLPAVSIRKPPRVCHFIKRRRAGPIKTLRPPGRTSMNSWRGRETTASSSSLWAPWWPPCPRRRPGSSSTPSGRSLNGYDAAFAAALA